MKNITLLLLILNVHFAFSQNSPIDFEPDGFGASWTWATFEAPEGEENPTFSVVANPSIDEVNGSATVAKMDTRYATDANWGSSGCESMHGSDIGTFTITQANKVVKMMIYQEGFAAPVALKFASPSGFALGEIVTQNTVADAWVEVEFNMSGWIGAPETPDQIIFFPSYAPRSTGHVVYFDNVTFNETGSGTGSGDGPMVAAPTPTRDAADVRSVFSDTYDNVPVENLNPNWGQTTIVTQEVIEGNNTLVYSGLDYQGLQLNGTLDISGMTHLHLDYWTANSTALDVFIISPGPVETPSALAVPTSGWASVDIPLTAFSPVDLANLIQFKFVGNGDIYLDNIYFYKGEGGTGGGDAPTVGAPVPTRAAADVISVFSDTYDNAPVENLNPDWGQATVVTEESIGGNNTLVYKGLDYQGLQLDGTLDVSGMTHLHLDYWTANSTALNVFLISDGPVETPSALAVPTSGWASVDIPLTAFSPVDLAALIQFKFDGTGDIYLDNIYFYKGEGTGGDDVPTVGAPVPTRAAADVISVFSDTYDNVPVENLNPNWGQTTVVTEESIGGNNTLVYKGLDYQGLQLDGTLDVSGMTHLHLDYWTANSTTLNVYLISDGPVETPSALAVPTSGWASVDIPLTAFSPVDLAALIQFKFDGTGDIYLDNIYFYKGEGTGGDDVPTVGAPAPIHASSDVLSVFSDTYDNVPVENLNPDWGQTTVVTEEAIGGDNTLVYKGLNYQGLQLDGTLDVSGMTHLHLDYWTANSTALNVYLISDGPVETPSALAVPTSGWASVDIPLTAFSPVDLAALIQFKFDGNGNIYLDNIYFHRNVVGINDIPLESIGTLYPNPTQSIWTVKTQNAKMSKIEVFDMAGRSVLSMATDDVIEAQIDGRNLNTGLYFAQITTSEGVVSTKLIKE